jgi:chromosome partitioning protein
MLTTLVASSKGGCGKSTLVTQLASHWAQAGKRTVIVDADRQGSSFRWATLRPDNVPGVLALEGGRKALKRVPPDTDQLLIDTPAGVGERELEPYLEQADVLLVPVLPSSFDLHATLGFIETLQQINRVRRGKLPVALVAHRLYPWTSITSPSMCAIISKTGRPFCAGSNANTNASTKARTRRGHHGAPSPNRSSPCAN